MSAKPTTNIRIDEELKAESKLVLDELGLDMSSAVTLFLKQVVKNKCIPFEITTKPLSEKELKRCRNRLLNYLEVSSEAK